MNKPNFGLFLATIFLLSSQFVFATGEAITFRGKIERINNASYLSESRSKLSLKMDYSNEISKQQIDRLNAGDYVSVTATVDENNPNHIYVNSVDYVGLKALLGTWKSEINLCYEFTGFTTFYVYTPNNKGLCVRQNNKAPNKPQTNKYNFFINPDIDTWNLLISSQDNNFVGELMIHDENNIEIQLFDNQTDAVLDSIVLRRLLSANSKSKRSLLL